MPCLARISISFNTPLYSLPAKKIPKCYSALAMQMAAACGNFFMNKYLCKICKGYSASAAPDRDKDDIIRIEIIIEKRSEI